MNSEELNALSKGQIGEITKRLQQYINHKRLSRHEFGQRSSIAAGGISRAINSNGDYSPGLGKVLNIINAFPDLNPYWFPFGEGEMLGTPVSSEVTIKQALEDNETLKLENAMLRAKIEGMEAVLNAIQKGGLLPGS